jgi:hypothetical protein
MFENISWQTYAWLLVVLTLLYYSFVFLVVFKVLSVGPKTNSRQVTRQDQAAFDSAEQLKSELQVMIGHAASRKLSKEELLVALENKLKSNPQLKGTAFEVAIINHIMMQSILLAGQQFSKKEIEIIW